MIEISYDGEGHGRGRVMAVVEALEVFRGDPLQVGPPVIASASTRLQSELPLPEISGQHPGRIQDSPHVLEELAWPRIDLQGHWLAVSIHDRRVHGVGRNDAREPFDGERTMLAADRDVVPSMIRCRDAVSAYREPAVTRIVRARLERVARFCRRRDYDIYVDPARYAGFPRMFAGRPLVDPALSPLGATPMPSIRDAHVFAAMRGRAGAETRQQIDSVARYFASPRYDALARGYGICQLGHRRFWAIGWDVRLPEKPSGLALQNLLLFARFPAARRTPRFRRWLERLEEHREDDGSYSLPRAMLPEQAVAYWVGGGHMGLEESRRSAKSLRLESTFWMLALRSLLRS